MRSQDLVHFCSKLRTLCSALRSAGSVCKNKTNIAPLLWIAADFLDGGGSIFWSQVPVLLEDWASGDFGARGEVAPVSQAQKRSHRRVWSVDQATSLVSCTPELSAAPKSPAPIERQFSHRKQLSESGAGALESSVAAPIRWRHSVGGPSAHPAAHLRRSPSVLSSRQ